jgi:RNA polymerase sigma-70 factor (ECF subfamily)
MEILEWIDRCKGGENRAVEEFAERFSPSIYRLAWAMLNDPMEASEAAQDALVSAWIGLKTYRGRSSLSTWIYSIALNECRVRLRKRKVKEKLHRLLVTFHFLDEKPPDDPEDKLVRSEDEKRVWDAVSSLGDAHRTVVVLRYYQDLSLREIAEILGLNEGTVSSRLNIARSRLRQYLNQSDPDIQFHLIKGGLNGYPE